ncbi:EamA family transporter RarD [Candidatus Halocynthiibacter alkanivorans]|uniref:EamA family transporter RarD n=1 Tax=Candidatus Halocynthiibacter alkanivorans TaxID=2267619 RepID=UPI000DF32395|nr:EamA family transporter RarD [Candidatus Halocynthiibacter alkanivorans]
MTEPKKGVLAIIVCCTVWGLSAIYYKALSHVPPLEVLSHRTLWSFVFFGLVLLLQRRLALVPTLIRKHFAVVLAAAVAISTNWFLFILSVQIGRATEASLGYYIFPLVAVLLGRFVLGEQLSRVKWLAVGMAALAVVLLTWGLGIAPWISLALAITFGFYGLFKKSMAAGPVVSVAAEVTILLPLALVWLYGAHFAGWQGVTGRAGGFFGGNLSDTLLLIGAGPLTAVPLMLFSYGSRRVTLSTVGLVQYLNPTLQFAVAVFVFSESFTLWHAIAFAIIWTALAIYSFDALTADRRVQAKRARSNS